MGGHGERGGVLSMCEAVTAAALTLSLRDVPRGWGLVPVHSESPIGENHHCSLPYGPTSHSPIEKALTDFLEDFPFEDGSYY